MSAAIWALAAWLSAAGGWPGPARGGRAEAHVQNAACEGCHVEVAREWRGSLHQRAYVDAAFAEALAREPSPFCRGCHAPEADPRAPAPAELAELGVGCVSCHVPGDMVLATPGPGKGAAAHAVRRLPGFAGDQACAGCHEFEFPRAPGQWLQRTIGEHAESAYATTSCADCHMPRLAGGRRDHRFAGARDPALLRRALKVTAARAGATARLTLEPGWVGHAVPTGDLFRRLVVAAEVVEDGEVIARDERVLGRRFAAQHGPRVEVADERVGPGAAEVELELGAAAEDRTIRWRVRHERVAFAASDDSVVQVWDGTTIAEGSLAPRRRSER